MIFEYDHSKSEINKAKHSIDFELTQQIWSDDYRLEISAKNISEPRHLVVGLIAGKHWSAVVKYRGENRRIISVRRSRIEEVEIYENY